MSSTIQLKTGTGSAVPSSLTQGEVAINVDNGLFYYGSGSTNTPKQLESFTHITSSGDISASGDITAHSASFTGPVKISLATGGTALEITEEDEDQKGRLLFEYDDGNPTLTIASRVSTAKLHIRQDSGTNGLYFDEDGQIYVNNSTADGVKLEGTAFSSIGTNSNALDLGKMNRPWKDLYLTGDGANIFFQDNVTSPELTLKYPANSNRLILSASDGHPTASFEVQGNISASGDLSALDLNLFGGGLSIKNQGAQSYARFYCESNNAHYTEVKAQPHSQFSGNPTMLLPAYDFNFASPDFGSASLTATNITASGNISASGEIETNTVSTVSTVIGSDAATNVDTFATSTYNGAIYDYILKDSTVGARAGQFMVAHDDGDVTFTDTSTKHLSDSTIPEITADISGGSTVRIRVTNGNGYTFKAFAKKL